MLSYFSESIHRAIKVKKLVQSMEITTATITGKCCNQHSNGALQNKSVKPSCLSCNWYHSRNLLNTLQNYTFGQKWYHVQCSKILVFKYLNAFEYNLKTASPTKKLNFFIVRKTNVSIKNQRPQGP